MKIRTDDAIWRARLVWLGWQGVTLPVHLPYQQWGAWFGLTVVLGGLSWLIFGSALAVPPAAVVALFATTLLFQFADPERPARKVVRTVLTDWRADRPADEVQELPTLHATHVTLGGPR